ncbi:unnamed protein product [Caenorhabditis auriculariae]|uniref:Peptidase M13 C-terminal domain-containing protein n=1 Tax=Caenorhabditis auriculariae TaxID=2777116 RepID=A0A8S1GRJ9_9PELO|nr:unnamed protein product [Caenorhabditis auriculariae]
MFIRPSFLLVFLTRLATACLDHEDLVKSHIQTKINKTADPCTDFYAHVCPSNLPLNQTVGERLRQLYLQEAAKFHTKHDEFTKQIYTYVHNFRKVVNDLIEVCEITGDNKSLAIDFVNQTTRIAFNESSSCEAIGYTFGLSAFMLDPYELYGLLLDICFFGPRELEFSKSDLGHLLNKNEEKFMNSFKDEVRKKFLETPWLKNKNGTEVYLEFLENDFSLFKKTENIIHSWEKIFDDLENYSKSCKPNNTISSFVCAIEKLIALVRKKARPSFEFTMFEPSLNAGNLENEIKINRATQLLTLTDNMARLYGSYGFIVGHEVMHSFYSSGKDDNRLKDYWTDSSQCVGEQYTATCNEFGNEDCLPAGTDKTNEEDGSDLASIRVVYSDFQKNYLHNEKSDIDGITSEQMFFYAFASMWCTPRMFAFGNPVDVHSGPYIRVNALLAQMDEFKEAFQCAENSRMVKSKVEHCSIFRSGCAANQKE